MDEKQFLRLLELKFNVSTTRIRDLEQEVARLKKELENEKSNTSTDVVSPE